MKKQFLFIIAIVFGFTVAAQAQNQGKYGHVNSQEVLRGMPGIDSLQVKLEKFQKSLEEEFNMMVEEFQTKKEKLDTDGAFMSSSVRKMREEELLSLQNRIQEFQYNVQDDLQEEQMKLLQPFQEKLQNAINDVAKENGFTYIFDVQTLLYADGGEDITVLVKKKLGIK